MKWQALTIPMVISILPFAAMAAAESNPSADGSRIICKVGQKVTGSRMRAPRRCRTEEQWRAEEEKASRKPETLRVGAPKEDGPQRPR
jgi:hypothetical protein